MPDQTALIEALQRENAALRESQRIYQSLFDALNGFAYCRMLYEDGQPTDFMYLMVNHAFEVQTGLKDVIGKRITEVAPGIRASDPQLFEIYGRVARTGQPEQFEMFVAALQLWFAVSVSSPAPEYFIAVFDVITARKQAEDTLRHSELKFRSFMEQSAEGAALIDAHGVIVEWNSAYEQITGLSRAAVLGQFAWDVQARLVRPQDRERLTPERLQANISQALQSGRLPVLETAGERAIQTPAGESKTILQSLFLIPGEHGPSLGVIARDITERKRAEDALSASEAQYRLLFENMAEGFALHEIITDELGRPIDFRFLDANAAYERHTGQKPQDIIGRTMLDIMPQADPHQIEAYGQVALTGKPLTFEYLSKTFSRHFHVRAFRPQPGRFATIFEDITERKQAEEAIAALALRNQTLLQTASEGIHVLNKIAKRLQTKPSSLSHNGVCLASKSHYRRTRWLHTRLYSNCPVRCAGGCTA